MRKAHDPFALTRDDVLRLLYETPYEELRQIADEIRTTTMGSHVNVRGIVEFSNICQRNCRYCGLQIGNRTLHRFRLTKDEVMESAGRAASVGCDTIVLQSGEVRSHPEWLADIISTIKSTLPVAVTLSVGEHPKSSYALWKEAGADRFLLKHETANAELYARLHPGWTLQQRVDALRDLQDLEYMAGTGFIIGVPGQTPDMLADDILLARDLQVQMCGVGPFLPQKDTPLGDQPPGGVSITWRVMAVLRMVLPYAHLPATTALASLDVANGQREGLRAGGNVIMIGFTPADYRGDYRLYDNKHRIDVIEAMQIIEGAGRTHVLHEATQPSA